MKLVKNHIIQGKIECLSGLHIGGNKDNIEIGDIDNPVIKNPITGYPYIPGSSLKGSLRSGMELKNGKLGFGDKQGNQGPCSCGKCDICKIFGTTAKKHSLGPTRIIVRDANLSEETKAMIREKELGDYLEIKTEATIDRNSGKAFNPRTQERVPESFRFDLEIVVKQLDIDNEQNIINFVKEAMSQLEYSYLGGSGSRGSGKIKFVDLTLDGQKINL